MAGVNGRLRQLAVEAALVALTLLGVAWLVRALPLTPADRRAAWTATTGDLELRGSLWPARLGLNRLAVQTADPAALADAEVEALFLPVGGGAVVAQRRLLWDAAAGEFAGGGFALTRAGPWQLLVTIKRPDQPAEYARLDWTIEADGGAWLAAEPRSGWVELAGWVNRYGAWATAALAVGGVAGWGRRAWRLWRPAQTAA